METVSRCFYFWLVTALLCSCGGVVSGQDYWNGIVGVEAAGGRGTGFAVAASDSRVEVWTAGHVTGPVGSPAIVVFSGGRKATGVVARRKYNAKGDGPDRAKIICDRPDGDVQTIPVCVGGCGVSDLSFFAGYSMGPETQRQVQIKMTPAEPFPSRVTARPAPDSGDSGGPVINSDGVVVGVVTQRTVERFPRLLFIPISKWVNDD